MKPQPCQLDYVCQRAGVGGGGKGGTISAPTVRVNNIQMWIS
jgi:hypothetical protein